MQLNRKKRRLTAALGLITAGLFVAAGTHAQDVSQNINDDTSTDANLTRVDSAILFYQEASGRVKAIEPVTSVTFNDDSGDSLHVKLTADTLTGATPNGAAPWTGVQTFITPSKTQGQQTTVTSASGNSQLVPIPGTNVKARQYTAAANSLPVDTGFRDQRYAVDLGYTGTLDNGDRLSLGGALSTEHDYGSMSANIGYARDFNDKNTTASIALNLESDTSRPYLGTPTPFTEMNGSVKSGNRKKTVVDMVAGVTQVMNRYWLVQLNYSLGDTSGYQTDPYRIISVVDGTTGAPVRYLYESRPSSRVRQSLYLGNKLALWGTVADISARLYHDSWGINAETLEVAERIPLGSRLYVEPNVRYYHQTKANFFHDYLIDGQALPANASSDSRLGAFNATTIGLKIGMRVLGNDELYLRAASYQQTGTQHPSYAIGDLKQENLFTGIKATSVIIGYNFAFY
ncbi:DUF3570 domain-containing protein [Asticcacaulis sp. EMRT-3]|uniref:DUF3570 domain-containing protein n=1 Tax=Asticcacaulis sp. EMRT-3 TaxID=3040349 RepID=UPI0024AF2039|nr:DUF3570 domain-containing protein [Asticcacaulis sp. EMRT-3]MDI7776263.1 DUF3570 domain-containing protein [Asticcacaulis sp. EMRT-3]